MFEFGKTGSSKTGRQSTASRLAGLASAKKVDILEPGEATASETRDAERFVPLRTSTTLTTAKGRRIEGRVVNLSSAGVAVEVNIQQIKTDPVVMVGSRPVRSGRPIALGMVFLFVRPIDRALCNPDIIL